MRKKRSRSLGKPGPLSPLARGIRLLAVELAALLPSMLIVGLVAVLAITISDHIYNIKHPIPDPVERGDDLGAGLIVVTGALGSLLISIPISVLVHIFVYKRLFKWVKNG